jgi:hypothetical protein
MPPNGEPGTSPNRAAEPSVDLNSIVLRACRRKSDPSARRLAKHSHGDGRTAAQHPLNGSSRSDCCDQREQRAAPGICPSPPPAGVVQTRVRPERRALLSAPERAQHLSKSLKSVPTLAIGDWLSSPPSEPRSDFSRMVPPSPDQGSNCPVEPQQNFLNLSKRE